MSEPFRFDVSELWPTDGREHSRQSKVGLPLKNIISCGQQMSIFVTYRNPPQPLLTFIISI